MQHQVLRLTTRPLELNNKMKYALPLLLITALFFAAGIKATAAPLVGSYTINSAVATGGTNFQSFRNFADSLAVKGISGNVIATVTPGSGPYNEQVTFLTVNGASASAGVTIEGSGATLSAVTTSADRYAIRLADVQYFTINNLKVEMGAGSAGGFYGFHIYNTGNFITISNCDVTITGSTSTLFGGYIMSASTTSILDGGAFGNITIDNNRSTGGGYGISCYGTSGSVATNVVISNNTIMDTYSNAIYVHTTNGIVIRGNTINFAGSNGIQLAGGNNTNALVEKNWVSATNPTITTTLRAIYIFGNNQALPNKVINNVIWNMDASRADIIALTAREGGEFYFNTVILNDTTSVADGSVGFEETLSNSGTVLKNNIFYITSTTSAAGYSAAIALFGTSAVANAITSDNNIFFIPDGHIAVNKDINFSSPPVATYHTLASWQAASGEDANSLAVNPAFASAILPQPTNGIINNIGTPIAGVVDDITGAAGNRTTTPDPGAYEFTTGANDATIIAIVSPSSCNTTLPVEAVLGNAGSSPLNSVTITWSVNGSGQPQVAFSNLNLAPGADTTLTLGNITVASNSLYDITATTSNPNGGTDTNPNNDSFTEVGWRMAFGGTYSINSAALQSATNFHSFDDIFDELSLYGVCAPVVINVSNGPYTEQVVAMAVPNTSAVNTITINGGGQVLQFDAPASPNDYADLATFVMDGISYLTVDRLTVNGLDAANAAGFNIIHGASHITVSNCEINIPLTLLGNSNGGGILVSEDYLAESLPVSDDLNFIGNTITGGNIFVVGEFTATPPANHHSNVNIIGNTLIDGISDCIYVSAVLNAVVRGNDLSSPTETPTGTLAAISMYAGSYDFILEENRIHDFIGTSGIYCIDLTGGFYPANGVVRNNLIYSITNTGFTYGIQDGGGSSPSTAPVDIYHNTIVLDAAGGSGSKTAYQWDAGSTTITRNLKNNIFVINSSSSGTKVLIDVSNSNNSSLLNSDNNVLWFGPLTAGTQRFGDLGSTPYTTFAAWQGAGKDVNGVNADPQFADPSSGDYRPTAAAINNKGAAVGVTHDILGALRSLSTPDPGAYEFSLCNPPAAPGTITGNATVCQNAAGATYSVAPISGISTYNWSVPSGAIITGGQGTNSITVTFQTASGNIAVGVEDTCGVSAPSTLAVTVTNTPGVPTVINGDNSVCQGTTNTYTTPTVAGATSYTWTAPGGATITSGQGTGTVNIQFNSTPGGFVTVKADNSCGSSNPIALNITVNTTPSVSLALPADTLCATAAALTLSGGSPAGGTYSGTAVAAGEFTPATAGAGSYTITYTYDDGSGCTGSATDNIVVEVCPGIHDAAAPEIGVYPNPFTTALTVSLSNAPGEQVFITLYDAVGKQATRQQLTGNQLVIDRGSLAAGVYTLVAESENNVIARRKVVVQ